MSLSITATLFAQDGSPTDKAQVPETGAVPSLEPVKTVVTVTGTRSPMEIDKSPVSTSLISRTELESRNIRQIDQALTLIEGVNASRARGPSDSDFGLGLRGFSGRGGQSRTLVLVDGQPINNSYIGSVNWSAFAVSEMDRVEVASGPFSSLYGGNAMGGVINLITRPVDRRHIEVFGQYGNRDTTNYSLRAADRFFDKLGVSVGYSRFQTGGYSSQETLRPAGTVTGGTEVTGVRPWLTTTGGVTYQVGEQGRNWFHQEAWRVRGEYTVSPKLFISAQYVRQSRVTGFDAYSTFLRDASGNPIDAGTVAFLDGGVLRRLTLSPSNFIGTPAGAHSNIYQTQILTTLSPAWNLRIAAGFNYSPGDWFVSPGADATLSGGTGSYTNTVNQGIYGNVQVTRQSSSQGIVFGAETRHDRARTAGQPVPNYAVRANGSDYTSQAFGKAINQAAYAQYQWNGIENLNIVAGGRWDYWSTYDGGNQTAVHQIPTRFPDRSTDSLTGKLAAVYSLPAGWQLRGSIGNAFRNPSVYELYRDFVLVGNLLLANPKILPERLLAYEAGISRAFSSGHSVRLTLFENRVSDLIYRVTDFDADPTGRLRRLMNAGLGRTRGAEFAARQRITSWLQFGQTWTYTNAVITRNDSLPATVGKRIPWVPLHTVAYMATAAKGRWTATWTGRYTGHLYSTDTNIDTTRGVPGAYDPFFETDATVSCEINRRWSLLATADNLLDRRYHQFYLAQGRSVFAGFRFRL